MIAFIGSVGGTGSGFRLSVVSLDGSVVTGRDDLFSTSWSPDSRALVSYLTRTGLVTVAVPSGDLSVFYSAPGGSITGATYLHDRYVIFVRGGDLLVLNSSAEVTMRISDPDGGRFQGELAGYGPLSTSPDWQCALSNVLQRRAQPSDPIRWRAGAICLNQGTIASISDLGEGLPVAWAGDRVWRS